MTGFFSCHMEIEIRSGTGLIRKSVDLVPLGKLSRFSIVGSIPRNLKRLTPALDYHFHILYNNEKINTI